MESMIPPVMMGSSSRSDRAGCFTILAQMNPRSRAITSSRVTSATDRRADLPQVALAAGAARQLAAGRLGDPAALDEADGADGDSQPIQHGSSQGPFDRAHAARLRQRLAELGDDHDAL